MGSRAPESKNGDHFFTATSPQMVDGLAFSSDPGVSGVRSVGSLLSPSLTETPFADLTDVTLADEDTNPILTDNAHRTFQGNLATRVTQPGGQIWNQAMQVT